MSWDHAENNERRGPVDEVAFQSLVAAGTIQPGTLVWRDGMAQWTPLSDSGYQAGAVSPPPVAAAGAEGSQGSRTGPAVPMGVCSESGRILPRSELVEIDGRLVSAEYKNVVLQRIREGVSGSGAAADPEALGQQIVARGYDLAIGSCVSRSWALLKGNFWLATGATLLVYLIIMAASIIPFGSIIVQGPLIGGLYLVFLKLIRREPAAVGDAFQCFSKGWGQLLAVTLVGGLLVIPAFLPGVLVMAAGSVGRTTPAIPAMIIGGLLFFAGFLFAIYLTVGWIFALPLVADKQIEFWPAMKLSRRVVGLHWWRVFGLLIVITVVITGLLLIGILLLVLIAALLIALAGAVSGKSSTMVVAVSVITGIVMVLGLFAVLPMGFCAVAVAYEDIFGAPAVR